MIKLTDEQLAAVENSGGALLVSAAAGSGKTKVLVERLLSHVLSDENGCDVDDFLIITYTNAAASELRGKILDAIYERIAADPENRRLRREADICGRADISTIHGFCSRVIKENAHFLGLNPNFRVADESESYNLKDEVLSDMLEEAYSSGEAGFLTLADTMGAGRDDSHLVSIILETHEKLLSHPYPEKWVAEQLGELEKENSADLADTVWGRVIIDKIERTTDFALLRMRALLSEAEADEEVSKAWGESLEVTYGELLALKARIGKSWDSVREALNVEFPRVKPLRGSDYDGLKAIRNSVKDEMKKLMELMRDTAEKSIEDMNKVAPEIRSLFEFVLEFDRRYGEHKRKRGVLDFHDQEHLALRLLVNPDTSEPTETARKLAERYVEIMVDEYQDVNAIQELIFNAVSRYGKNVFMVGDVKQSIYRFRLADPTIFLKKYTSYKDAESAADGEGRRIILSRNFRSRAGILGGTNYVFRNIMSREFGEMDYTDMEALKAGAEYPESDEADIELDVLDMKSLEDDDDADKTEIEAGFAAKRISELMRSFRVAEGEGTRPLRYGDIAILMRSPGSRAAVWIDALSRRGIPARFGSDSEFFETPEISMAMAFAAVIDNPRQDIPLITVMRSPVYGFTSEELALIRAENREDDFYSAALSYTENNPKLSRFFSDIEEFRSEAPDMPADELLWKVFSKTGFFASVSAMPGGEKRLTNVMRFLEAAKSFESVGYKGIYGFVNYLNKLVEQGKTLAAENVGENANSVTIMSVHKSKGLEFPVVILADTAKRFNEEDTRFPLLIHAKLGVGPNVVDLKRRIEYPTFAKRAIKTVIKSENMSEELRVLYVAMTRAMEKLIILSTFADAERELTKLAASPLPVPPVTLDGARSFSDFILLPALRRAECEPLRFGVPNVPADTEDKPWAVNLISDLDFDEDAQEHTKAEAEIFTEEELTALEHRLGGEYPYLSSVNTPSKVTATELKGGFYEAETHEDASEIERPARKLTPPRRPEFSGDKRRLTPAQRGTAVHLVMQYADYDRCKTYEGARAEIERLRLMKNLTDEEAAAVSPKLISDFFSSETGKLILSADHMWRELKFSTLIDSGRFPAFPQGEELLLQGVVDCVIEKNGELTVIDFKTDRVDADSIKERSEYYRGQLEAYTYAMEKIIKKPVVKRILHYLTAGLSYEV